VAAAGASATPFSSLRDVLPVTEGTAASGMLDNKPAPAVQRRRLGLPRPRGRLANPHGLRHDDRARHAKRSGLRKRARRIL